MQAKPEDEDYKLLFYVAKDPMVITNDEREERDIINDQCKELYKIQLDTWKKSGGRQQGKPKPFRDRWCVQRTAPFVELAECHTLIDNVTMDHFVPGSKLRSRTCFNAVGLN